MTAVAVAQAPAQRKPSQAKLTAEVVAVLRTAMTAAAIVAALRSLFRSAGIGALALKAASALILTWLPSLMEGTGPATRWAVRTNDLRRAQFFVAACRRMQAAADEAKSRNEPVRDAVAKALAAEKRYLAQHLQASDQRTAAASRVDGMASEYGDLLGWNAIKDARCTPECRAADGKSFHASRPPLIGYPGTAHPACRCFPGPPRPGARILP